jgi:hypothetical protein
MPEHICADYMTMPKVATVLDEIHALDAAHHTPLVTNRQS